MKKLIVIAFLTMVLFIALTAGNTNKNYTMTTESQGLVQTVWNLVSDN